MGLFNKKVKYDITEEENVPQFVYGIPDNLRKQWEEESTEENQKIDNNCIFEAFEGGYSGPSYYYFINEKDDKYYFRFGYSKDGMIILNSHNNKNIKEFKQNKEYYNKMINEINSIVKNWKNTYNNNEIDDGTQWHLDIKGDLKKYSGSNDFPDNYYDLINTLKKYFNISSFINEKSNYDINPEDNIPQKVYGVLNPKIENNTSEINGINISINNYSLSIIKLPTTANLLYRDNNKVSYLSDIVIIPISKFDSFLSRFNNIICDWDNNYADDKNIKWSITITYENTKKNIVGNGEFPKLWNKFIELLSEYEILYKKIVISNNEEKSNEH